MQDHLRFYRELIALRTAPARARAEAINVFHVHDANRVIAFQRWIVGSGRDIVVAASLNEATYWSYAIGFPGPGRWLEVFNSDVYDNWVNPIVAGNGGGVDAERAAPARPALLRHRRNPGQRLRCLRPRRRGLRLRLFGRGSFLRSNRAG